MSGVLHPVGPEPPQVYWVRRVIVIAAAVLGLVLVIAVVANLNSAASATGPEAVPAAPVSTSSSSGASDSTLPSTSVSASASSSASAPSAEPTLSVISPTATAKASESARPSTKPTASASASASAGSHARKSSPAAVAACDPAQLRQTLTGSQRVAAKSKTPLSLSLINGGPSTCQLRLSPDDFVLTIYSGKDRIWSTADCADLVKPTAVKIASQAAYEWQIVWNGLRSKKSCQSRPEIPRPGTYVATAQFTGADPVRFRMFVH